MLNMVAKTDNRLRDFGRALREALSVQKMTQEGLGDRLGVSQPAVSDWINGESEPAPEMVFVIESQLKIPPGSLSRHLGYLPPQALKHVATVRDAIMGDTSLSVAEKEMLLGAYSAAVAGKARKTGRPAKRT